MDITEKLIKICNVIGEIRGKKPDFQRLIDNFTRSFEFPADTELIVITNKNNSVYLSIKEIRSILIGGEIRNIPSKGRVERVHAAIALLEWTEWDSKE